MEPEKPKNLIPVPQSTKQKIDPKTIRISTPSSGKSSPPIGSQNKPLEVGKGRSLLNDEKEIDPKTLTVPTSQPKQQPLTLHPAESTETDKSNEGDGIQINITNAEFINAVFQDIPQGAYAAVCSKPGDPAKGGWLAQRADSTVAQLAADHNNYFNCSSFYPGEDGSFLARKERFAAYQCVVLDDIGTKISLKRLENFKVSWKLETSPGNYQVGIILAEPITEGAEAEHLLKTLIDAGLCDPGASGPLARWMRLPIGINGKSKYVNKIGKLFRCRLVKWHPERRYTPQEIIDALKLKPVSSRNQKKVTKPATDEADGVLTPKAKVNPIVSALKALGLYKKSLGSGKHDITCPWVHEHTGALDDGAAYFEPDEPYPIGGFRCHHSHGDRYHIRELLEFLDVSNALARHKSIIRVIAGDLHLVVDAAEKVLADRGQYYQSGGLIVSIVTDPITSDSKIVPINAPALTKELSTLAIWEKYDGRSKSWVRCDPPMNHVNILYNAGSYHYLPPLAGIVRQPYFRESDDVLVTQPGYDDISQYFGVFDPGEFTLPEPTLKAAQVSLALLEELLVEFHFVSVTDKAATLSAIFTAVVRATLPCAPGFHVKAPVYGTGKTYLCELIGAFAGPVANIKVSYPTTSEEATKVILSLLLNNPAVIEFDDMDTDWTPHGIIKRMLTTDKITDRILGVSKTATVSTRTLLLGSGNNVGPVRDLLRRVMTINLDPRCSTPATLSYKNYPVEKVRKNRGRYVSAVLTIIQAWRMAGSPRADVPSVANYNSAWSDFCRHPLIWLGLPDPATALIEQIKHDPDADALKELLREWNFVFGSQPTTVRKVIQYAQGESGSSKGSDINQALCEFPVLDNKGKINPSKLGWFLKKNANRIIDGYEFQKCEADGRTAWRVVNVKSSDSPPPVNQVAKKHEDEHELDVIDTLEIPGQTDTLSTEVDDRF
jgi:hypothetical protein